MQNMNSSSRWFEKSKDVESGEGTDRISALPDKVLGHILSFLPTKHAVGTCILSRRWQYLFTLVSNFDFDETLTFHYRCSTRHFALINKRMELCSLPGMEDIKWSSTFKDFVDRVLMLCKSTEISKFRINCDLGFDCSNVNAWIRFALIRGVTELDVFTYAYESSVLPLSLFFCETLVVLKLGGKFEMNLPTSVLLPHLKVLQLHSVTFSEDCSLNGLISGCPVLEDLVLKGSWEDVETINISSPRLINLTMDFSDIFMSCLHRNTVELDLPNLLHFNYVDYLADNYYIENMNSLEDARIDILLDIDNMDWDLVCESILELMNGVSSAKHLYFSGNCMEGLMGQFKLPTFNNLSCLELGWSKYVNWKDVLPNFLRSSPMLDSLVFPEGLQHRESDDDFDDKNYWGRLRKSPSCLSTHLKTITIECFHGFDEELKIAKYLLRHRKVLTKLILYWEIGSKKEYQDLMNLLKIGRLATKECSIELRLY